jgi:hypothetical protein
MKSFTDHAGRAWTIVVNVGAVKRVRSLCGVDLMEIVGDGGKMLERLVSDPVLLCDVIYAVCREEATARTVSDEDFGRLMAGDSIAQATDALLDELVDFFPRARREVLARVLDKMRRYEAKALSLANARLDDPALDQRVEKALEGALGLGGGDSLPNAPGSSESDPTPSP